MGSYKMLQLQIISYLTSLDHNTITLPFVASENAESMDELFGGTEEQLERTSAVDLTIVLELSDVFFVAYVKRWLHDGKGLMASKSVSVVHCFLIIFADISSQNSGSDAGIKMRPTNEELSSMSPEFDHRWSTYFANAPDKPVVYVVTIAWWVH